MNRKIIGILVCTLLMTTSLTIVVGAEKNFRAVDTCSSEDEVDVPVWSVGDSWTYKGRYKIAFQKNDFFEWISEDLKFTVANVAGASYRVEFIGNVTGEVGAVPFPYYIKEGTLEGYEIIGKGSLEVSKIVTHLEGIATVPLVGDTPITIDMTATSSPAFTYLDFPLSIGKTWTQPITRISVDYTIEILGSSVSKHHERSTPEHTFICTGKETITVEAGTYDTYRVVESRDACEIFYGPAAGNVVKGIGGSPNELPFLKIELVSTNYSPSGAPRRPAKPSGETSGEVDVIYQYCTSTTDPDNDQIYYWFDWDDGTNSGWVGPFNSGATACAEHSWANTGIYKVKVKAKDTSGLESKWSYPLVVNIGEEEDNEDPYVEITKPEENAVYYNNVKIASIPFTTIIIGYLNIEVYAYDALSGINRVEFHIDGVLRKKDYDEPYTCVFEESPGFHTIEATAYDNAGNSAKDSITVFKIF